MVRGQDLAAMAQAPALLADPPIHDGCNIH
jgi:hypothetical protein